MGRVLELETVAQWELREMEGWWGPQESQVKREEERRYTWWKMEDGRIRKIHTE